MIYLAVAPGVLDSSARDRQQLIAQAVAIVIILLIAGTIWPWTRHRALALVLIAGHAVPAAAGETWRGPRPAAGLLLLGRFATLVGGALISWCKSRLVVAIAEKEPPIPEPPAT